MYRSGIEGEWMKPRVSGSRVSKFKSEIVLHHHHHHHHHHLLHFCAVRLLRLTIIWIIEGSPHGKNHQIFRVKRYGLPPLNGWLVQGFVQNIQEVKYSSCAIYSSYATWWFPPIWKICSSNWMISLYRDENKKYLKIWNHHLVWCTSFPFRFLLVMNESICRKILFQHGGFSVGLSVPHFVFLTSHVSESFLCWFKRSYWKLIALPKTISLQVCPWKEEA